MKELNRKRSLTVEAVEAEEVKHEWTRITEDTDA
jgi:hypothetical protein